MKALAFLMLIAFGLLGQEKEESAPASASASIPACDKVEIGMAQRAVTGIMGRPNGIALDRPKRGQLTMDWIVGPHDTFVVVLKNHGPRTDFQVVSMRHVDSAVQTAESAPRSGSKAEHVVEKVADAVSGVYLTGACPPVYRKPLLLLTAADADLIRACSANGFMLFGLYIYTPPR